MKRIYLIQAILEVAHSPYTYVEKTPERCAKWSKYYADAKKNPCR